MHTLAIELTEAATAASATSPAPALTTAGHAARTEGQRPSQSSMYSQPHTSTVSIICKRPACGECVANIRARCKNNV